MLRNIFSPFLKLFPCLNFFLFLFFTTLCLHILFHCIMVAMEGGEGGTITISSQPHGYYLESTPKILKGGLNTNFCIQKLSFVPHPLAIIILLWLEFLAQKKLIV